MAPLALAIGACGCDPIVATLPTDRADPVMRALAQVQIPARRQRTGDQIAISVPRDHQGFARAVVRAVDRPTVVSRAPSLIRGPTEAKLDAQALDRQHLEATIAALPDVLVARLARIDDAWIAVITTQPEPGDVAGQVRALLGPQARVQIEPLRAPQVMTGGAIASSPPRPFALSAAVVVLSLMILALLAHVRRLRRSLGR